MSVNEIADVSIDENAEGLTLATFNIPGILGSAADGLPAAYADIRAKTYTTDEEGKAGVVSDWGADSDANAQFLRMCAQEPRPAEAYLIGRDAPVAVVKKVTFTGLFTAGTSCIITVNGQATASISYATSHANTLGLIATAVAGLSGVDTAVDDDTDDITITGDLEWPLDISVATAGTGAPTAAVSTTTAGRTAADDLAAALAEDDTNKWYGFCDSDNNKGVALVLSAAAETTEKLYFVLTNETASKTAGGTDSLASRISTKSYRRTVGFWHHDLSQCLAAGALAVYLAKDPGEDHLHLRNVAGVDPTPTSALSAAEKTVVEGRNFNTYRMFGDQGGIRKGKRADGKVPEATRDLDYARNDLRARIVLYARTPKPPFDAGGFSAFRAVLEACARHLVEKKIARTSPAPAIFIPKFENLTPTQLDAQIIPNTSISFDLLKGMIGAQVTLKPTI